jgi:hypothetical protein
MAVRLGEVALPDVIKTIERLERQMCVLTYGQDSEPKTAAARRDFSNGTSPLQDHADRARIDQLLVRIYTEAWKELWT